MGPGDLTEALRGLEIPADPNVLTGIDGLEDAGVYRLDEQTALVQTLDFFTPIVDDARIFGRVAAANALSDVYAMGGRPLTALNIVCFPTKKLGVAVLRSVLKGGLDILQEAGVALIGGHSVEDDEPKYGLSVTGIVHPDRIMTNSGLQPGDQLFLTKAIGTGVIATALKGGLATEGAVEAMVSSMCILNKKASEVALKFRLKACTDVTGFGLAGHLVEMARSSRCTIRIRSESVPVLKGAREAASMGLVPGGAHSNRKYFSPWIEIDPRIPVETSDLMFDPQTSGGLILAIDVGRAAEFAEALLREEVETTAPIGEVVAPDRDGRLEIV